MVTIAVWHSLLLWLPHPYGSTTELFFNTPLFLILGNCFKPCLLVTHPLSWPCPPPFPHVHHSIVWTCKESSIRLPSPLFLNSSATPTIVMAAAICASKRYPNNLPRFLTVGRGGGGIATNQICYLLFNRWYKLWCNDLNFVYNSYWWNDVIVWFCAKGRFDEAFI